MNLSVKFGSPRLKVGFDNNRLGVSTGNPIIRGSGDLDPYTGEYTITPSNQTQTYRTKNTYMTENIVVEPIPSNYGLITWNGSTLTVS